MNPFKTFMNSMMMGLRCAPFMSFGCGMPPFMPSLFCGCNFMSMPYRQDDNLWFFNSPIYRDTSYDYLLDPNLALRNVQAQMQNGALYGNTWLPGFTFPQIGGAGTLPAIPGMPTLPGSSVQQPAQKTPEQVEAEKKKEEEDKKPAAQQAKQLNEVFNQFKKLAEDEKNNLPEIPEELIAKAEEAMNKESADEQLEGMKEVISAIPESALRKTVLADSNIKEQLRRAGYNFNLSQNQYSLKNEDINANDLDNSDRARQLHSDILEKNYNELQVIAGQLADKNVAKTRILGIISSWNDKYKGNEKGIIRFIASNLPTGDDAIAKTDVVKGAVKTLTEALLEKADDYNGYSKITSARDDVTKNLDAVLGSNGFNRTNLIKLADSCDKLYARLRMQEAVKVRDAIIKKYSTLNDIKEGVIAENIVVEETIQDLKEEGITPPAVSDLDEAPKREEIILGDNSKINDAEEDAEADENYKDDKQALVDEYLVGEKQYLTKVSEDSNVYKTNVVKSEKYSKFNNGKFVEESKKADESGFERYFTVKDNKLIEVTKKADGTFEEPAEPKEVTAVEIGKQDAAVKKAQKLIDENKIVEYKIDGFNKFPLFKATGKNQFFAIIDGQFGKIKPTSKFDKDFAEKLTVENFDTSFKESDIVTAEAVKAEKERKAEERRIKEEEKKEQEMADVTAIEAYAGFSSLKDAQNNQSLKNLSWEAAKASNPELANDEEKNKEDDSKYNKHDFKALETQGYFYCQSKKRYYRFNEQTKRLVYLPDVTEVTDDGRIKYKNGNYGVCDENITDKSLTTPEEVIDAIQDYGEDFGNTVSGDTPKHRYAVAYRKLNTIIAKNKPVITVNFIKGYRKNCGFWTAQDYGICRQIATEGGMSDGEDCNELNTKKYYLAEIAKLVLKVYDETNLSFDSKDYQDLIDIANGEMKTGKDLESNSYFSSGYATGIKGTACKLDEIIIKVIEAYEENEK